MTKFITPSIIYSSLFFISLTGMTIEPNPVLTSPVLSNATIKIRQQQHEYRIKNSGLSANHQHILLKYFQSATLIGHAEAVTVIAFSPDGRLLASGSWNDAIVLWNISNPHHPQFFTILKNHARSVSALAFSPDSRLLASACENDTITIWDISNSLNPQLLTTLEDHTWSIYSLAFSPDGKLLASGSWDNTIKLWNVNDPHNSVKIITLNTNEANTNVVTFSPDGKLLAAGLTDNTIKFWDVNNLLSHQNNQQPLTTLQGHKGRIHQLAFSPDSKLLASQSSDSTINIWNVGNNYYSEQPLAFFNYAQSVPYISSIDGRRGASGLWEEVTLKTFSTNYNGEKLVISPFHDIFCCMKNNYIAIYSPYWTLPSDYIECLIRWYRDKPTFEDLSDEDKIMLANMPAGARPSFLVENQEQRLLRIIQMTYALDQA